MNLVVVESPTKAKTLAKFLGSDYQIEATMGHVRDLPESNLGVDVERDFEPLYEVNAKKMDVVKRLQTIAKQADTIYLAPDPDREGEAIAWHVAELLKNTKQKTTESNSADTNNKQFKRVTFHEITERAIKEALSKPGTINQNLVEAQTARRILDRLVGYQLSPVLWRKVRRGLSAGRVQSVTVRLIVEREREILAFKPVEYWEIYVLLSKANHGGDFWAKFSKVKEKSIKLDNEKSCSEVYQAITRGLYIVDSVNKKEVKKTPPPPFTTSTLQQVAASRFGWSSKRTMNAAQSLYEQGSITYHRTDSTHLAVEAVDNVRQYITKEYGQNFLPEKFRFYATKSKSAQEAHEAIRPTDIGNFKSQAPNNKNDEDRLYELIWKRFVACQMAEAVYDSVSVDILAVREYLFQVKGETQKFDGWKVLYNIKNENEKSKISDENENSQENEDNISINVSQSQIPELIIGETLTLIDSKQEQKFTQPPSRYNEASLIKTLEELGIGRPSTYAPTISTIQDRLYVEKVERNLLPTSLGVAVNDFLMANFSNIIDYQFTAKMEDDLDLIASGEKKRVPVLKEFHNPFIKQIEKVKDDAERVKVAVETTGDKCPKCNDGDVVIRLGKYGKFLSCSRYPNCDYRAPLIQKVAGKKCPKCGGDIVYKKTKKGKGFYGCASYPKCDWASWRKP